MTHWTPAKHMSGHLDRWLLITLAQVNPDLPGTRCSWTFFQTASNQLGIHISQLPKNGGWRWTEYSQHGIWPRICVQSQPPSPFFGGGRDSSCLGNWNLQMFHPSIKIHKLHSLSYNLRAVLCIQNDDHQISISTNIRMSTDIMYCQSSSHTSTNSSESHFLELFFVHMFVHHFFCMKTWENCQLFRKTSSIENESRDVMKSRHGRANRIHHLQPVIGRRVGHVSVL